MVCLRHHAAPVHYIVAHAQANERKADDGQRHIRTGKADEVEDLSLIHICILSGGCQVSGGTIQVEGQSLWALSARKRRELCGTTLGFIPQNPMTAFDPRLKMGRQMEETLRLRIGVSRKEAVERAETLLTELGLSQPRRVLDSYPAQLSGGMLDVYKRQVLEYIQGMSVVKSYGLDKDSGQAVQRTVDESCDKALSLEKSVIPWMGLRQVVVRVFSVAIAVCALAFYSGGTLSLARCLLMLVASFMLYAELESAGNMADNLQMLGASMDKANSIDDTPVMDIDGAELTPADTSVEFQDVSFAYGDRTILDHVSLTVPSGSITAVVGPSGGGKTTLCNLIARFWDVQSGKITVGGYDVREYKLDSLMKNISMVFQSVYLFNDTVENNIKFGRPDATHEQVVAAARAACCHDFIMALPDGYDTVLGEGGGSLSGGEKQRISIARAMLKDAPIVILDEATASVDPENEAELQAAISALTRGKTLIMIAHRLNTVRNADQILVLSGGHIVQRGTHQELMAQGGLYADFVGVRQEALRWKLDT